MNLSRRKLLRLAAPALILGASPRIARAMQVPLAWDNPFAFPAGRAPGFDPNHIASVGISPGHGFSGIATPGSNFVNLLTGLPGTPSGTITTGIDAGIGRYANLGINTTANITFSGQSTANDTVGTCGVMVSHLLQFNSKSFFQGGNAALTDGIRFSVANSQMVISTAGQSIGPILPATLTQAGAAHPMFLAFSTNVVASLGNFLYCDLVTGQVVTYSTTETGGTTASDGVYTVGNDAGAGGSNSVAGNFSHVMFAPSFMSIEGMLRWAERPWDFWYPPDTVSAELTDSISSGGGGAGWLPLFHH